MSAEPWDLEKQERVFEKNTVRDLTRLQQSNYPKHMNSIANIVVGLVAFLHLYFLVLEMFLWTKPRGLRAFGNTVEKAKSSAVLAANQGLYNGFLAAGLIWGLFHSTPEFALQVKVFFLSCVIVAGVYGAYSVSRKIFFIQALPALIGLVLVYCV